MPGFVHQLARDGTRLFAATHGPRSTSERVGHVFDALSGGQLARLEGAHTIALDRAAGLAYMADELLELGTNRVTAWSFDMDRYTLLSRFEVWGIDAFGQISALVRWGDNGLAFIKPDDVYLARIPGM